MDVDLLQVRGEALGVDLARVLQLRSDLVKRGVVAAQRE